MCSSSALNAINITARKVLNHSVQTTDVAGRLVAFNAAEQQELITCPKGEGDHSTMDSVLASHPAALGSIHGVPKNFSEFLMLARLINSAAA